MSWALVGALGLFGVLGAASIGLPILAVALILLVLTVVNYRAEGVMGLLTGAGLAFEAAGVLNFGNHPCTGQGFYIPPGQVGSVGCGGADPVPFFVIGTACVVLGVVSAAVLQVRRRA